MPQESFSQGVRMKGALRSYWRALFGNRTEKKLRDGLEKLSNCCQAPDPKAKGAPDLDEAMKQFTWWPEQQLLRQLEVSVMTLARTERKYPERRIWEAFELVDRRKTKLHLLKHINDLAGRARERFREANFSDLEALSCEQRENKDAADLLRDIDRVKKDVSVARAIHWARYKDILARFSEDGRFERDSGNDTALACYARVLELIVDHRKWEELRKESEALVFWLLRIAYPGVEERDGLEHYNRAASLRWILEEAARVSRERAAKLAKFQQTGRIVKKSKEDIEDDRLMELVRQGDASASEQLRNRHERWINKKVKE